MKKTRLLTSVCMLIMTVACLTFGVFSLISATYTTTATITFNAYELDILVHGQIIGAIDNGSLVTDYKNATTSTHSVSGYTTSGDGTLPTWGMGGLAFDELNENNLITIKFTISNYSNYAIEATASIENQSSLEQNLTITNQPIAYCCALANNGTDVIDSGELVLTFAPKADSAEFTKDLNITIDIIPSTKTPTTAGFTTSASGNNNTITQYAGTETNIIIPTIIEDKAITSIGENAFKDNTDLTSITIPSSVTSIGNYAFNGCKNLATITIPSGVTSIGDYAFNGCSSLSSIIIPDGIKILNGAVFQRCSSLTSITIPDTVTIIGPSAFNGCSNLKTVLLPNGVQQILISAFYQCASLTSITIPDSVTSIGDHVFYGCSSLSSVTIPNGVTSIGNYVFNGCTNLETITIPDGVTRIGDYVFQNCSKLTSITILDGVTSIGNYVFQNCSKLTSITIPSSVTSIGNYAFYGCSSLSSVTIPNGVTTIGNRAFRKCALTSITIPSRVTSIDEYAFYGCLTLNTVYIDSATVANSLTSIDASGYLLDNLTSGEKLYIKSDIETIGSYVTNEANFTKSANTEVVNGVTYYVYTKK